MKYPSTPQSCSDCDWTSLSASPKSANARAFYCECDTYILLYSSSKSSPRNWMRKEPRRWGLPSVIFILSVTKVQIGIVCSRRLSQRAECVYLSGHPSHDDAHLIRGEKERVLWITDWQHIRESLVCIWANVIAASCSSAFLVLVSHCRVAAGRWSLAACRSCLAPRKSPLSGASLDTQLATWRTEMYHLEASSKSPCS